MYARTPTTIASNQKRSPYARSDSVNNVTLELRSEYGDLWERIRRGFTLTDLDTRETEYGDEPYPIITVLAEEGSTLECESIHAGTELAWHAFHTIARREIAKQRPAIGDHIGIAYHGPAEKASAGFSPAERWRVIVDERATDAESSEPEGEGEIPY